MDLIDRYIAAVRRQLPQDKQDDIAQELSDSLRSEAEEREQRAGRALNDEEQAALLKPHGHPWLMASRYLPQQHLIGPALYPYYRQTLTMVVFWVVLPLTLVGGAVAAINSDHPSVWFSRMLAAAWNAAIYAVGIVTIVFAILEHERVRITAFDNWNPARLPMPDTGRSIPRSESVANLVVLLIMMVWWTELLRVPAVTDNYDGVPVRFAAAPIWAEVYWPVLAALAGGIAVSLVDMMRPSRSIAVSIADIAVNLYSLVVLVAIVRSPQYVQLVAEPIYADRVLEASNWINVVIYWSFLVMAVIIAFDAAREIWLVMRARGRRAALAL